MDILAYLIKLVIDAYIFVIIIQVAVSWLMAFDIINAGNQQAQNLVKFLRKLTDPVYQPLRKYVPAIGGIDITPIIVILGLSLLQSVLLSLIYGG